VALMGASPGGSGTILSQNAWLPVFRTLKADFWSGGRLQVSRAGDVFDADGEIVDEKIRERLRSFVRDFAAYAGSRAGRDG
jgi:chromate reductase, NAD(P)H dehydrogenase (quinone)